MAAAVKVLLHTCTFSPLRADSAFWGENVLGIRMGSFLVEA